MAELSGPVLRTADVEKGFSALLSNVEDLILDVPDVLRLLSCFIARAVIDEVLPPAFLLRVDLGVKDSGTQVLNQAQLLLNQERAAQRIESVWEEMEWEEEQKKKSPKQQTTTLNNHTEGAH